MPKALKTRREEFEAAVEKLAREDFPDLEGEYGIARVQRPRRATETKQQCVKWGYDPVTGKRICLKWEDV